MNRGFKRHTIAAFTTILTRLPFANLPSTVFNFIKRLFRLVMDYVLFSDHQNDDVLDLNLDNDREDLTSTPFDRNLAIQSFSDPGESLYLVPFRWWKEAKIGVEDGVGGVLYDAKVRIADNGDDDYSEVVRGYLENFEILVGLEREGICGGEKEDGDLALVSEWMFLTAIKWHYDSKDVESLLSGEDSVPDFFSLKTRILYWVQTSQLILRITRQDNRIEAFNRACGIFGMKSGLLKIWDFSGYTNQLFVDDISTSMSSGQSNEEIFLELQVYGLSCTIGDEESRKEYVNLEQSEPSSSSSHMTNGSVDNVKLLSRSPPSFKVGIGFNDTSALGLTGLYNLGNTCFMNSAIQCLVHTPKLVDYFLGNFRKDLNFENPLGMKGILAVAFGDLLRKLWAPQATSTSPRFFKSTISSFAPQFSGYNQHDSQEFLSFLLDGLHEDLNRVKSKTYVQIKDDDIRSDEEVADEYWENHLSRNDSIIVDLLQGQYRSSLVCPVCKKLSVTFDPFMYLSLPLPHTTLRKMTVTLLSIDGTSLPHPITVVVPYGGTSEDLTKALSAACSLRDNEMLIIAEVFSNSIIRTLDDPDGALELIRDFDRLVAYRLLKDTDGLPLVVFMHQHQEKPSDHKSLFTKAFGIPLLTRMPDLSEGRKIREEFLKIMNPLLLPQDELLSDDDTSMKSVREGEEVEAINLDDPGSSNDKSENAQAEHDFEFHFEDGDIREMIQMDEPVSVSINPNQVFKVFVSWSEAMIQKYDTSILSVLPEVCKPALKSQLTQDSISLYQCVDAFLKEEPLGPDDMWYCPNCKEHRQAIKKLDLWRLPEILVIHLKRFSYSRFFKNKLENFIDFPIDGFDLSSYAIKKNDGFSSRYRLYAMSNHYGGMGGGHYTAIAKHKQEQWYEFDDSSVFPVSEEQIKTPAAYVLFYKRI